MAEKDLLIRGGKLISPVDGFRGEIRDVLIRSGVIEQIGEKLAAEPEVRVLDADGKWVAPGFIDMHAHVLDVEDLLGGKALGLPADAVGVCQGTTTVVDAGTAGPGTMETFVEETVKKSRTRVYAAMHYATQGLRCPPEADAPEKYDLQVGLEAAKRYAPYIVAIKGRASATCVGELGITSIRAGKELAKAAGLPMLVHIGHMPPQIEDVLDTMERGDVITHAFHGKDNNLLSDGGIKPQTQAARDRGVLFDVGHGKDSFNFETGKKAGELGFVPDTISTDLHTGSFHKPVKSLAETASKFLALGYGLDWCIHRITAAPAAALKLEKLGHLQPGAWGDITVFHLEQGKYTFTDANKNVLQGTQMITPDYAVIGGKVEMDANDLFRTLCRTSAVDEEYWPEYEYMARTMEKTLEEQKIILDEGRKMAFLNHVIALLTRLRKKEHVPEMGDEILEELDGDTLQLADVVLKPACRWYGQADNAERVLVALHIQSAKTAASG